jgi:hypothetical protein
MPRRPYNRLLVEAVLLAAIWRLIGEFQETRQAVTNIYPFHVLLSHAHSAFTSLCTADLHASTAIGKERAQLRG